MDVIEPYGQARRFDGHKGLVNALPGRQQRGQLRYRSGDGRRTEGAVIELRVLARMGIPVLETDEMAVESNTAHLHGKRLVGGRHKSGRHQGAQHERRQQNARDQVASDAFVKTKAHKGIVV